MSWLTDAAIPATTSAPDRLPPVPHTHVRRVLTVLADPNEVRVVDGGAVLACHWRSYDRGAQIEQVEHVEALVEQKRAARELRATDRLIHAEARPC